MKILVISEVFYPENFLINDLVKEWKQQGFAVDIISQYPSYPESYVYPGYSNNGKEVKYIVSLLLKVIKLMSIKRFATT